MTDNVVSLPHPFSSPFALRGFLLSNAYNCLALFPSSQHPHPFSGPCRWCSSLQGAPAPPWGTFLWSLSDGAPPGEHQLANRCSWLRAAPWAHREFWLCDGSLCPGQHRGHWGMSAKYRISAGPSVPFSGVTFTEIILGLL